VVEFLYGYLDEASIKTSKLRAPDYMWIKLNGGTSLDGSTMIKIIIDEINPSTIVGTEGFRRKIQSARLNTFGYNVKNALEMDEYAYNGIIR